ncbi:Concanavalin A-like lectin/glucanases superfamily protein [uncultured archaeon]|nr:Concanavalin A-like lectin/glucanases superfamily protein [uncultured archaeon]
MADVRKDGLVGYWKFDEGQGTAAHDSSGNGNDGMLYNNPVWVDGKFGKGLQFNGVNNYVSIPPSPGLNLSIPNKATYSLWLKVGPWVQIWNGNNLTIPLYHGTWAYGQGFGVTNDPVPYAQGMITVNANSPPSATYTVDRTNFYYLSWTYNGSEWDVYMNGALRNTYNYPGTLNTTTFNNGIYIGAATGGLWRDFSGIIDEVKVYNKVVIPDDTINLKAA